MTTLDTPVTADFTTETDARPLDELPLGTSFRVVAVDETREGLLRLMEMGLIPGADGVLERSAPFKTPLSVRLVGCTLALRREDAHQVLVSPLNEFSPAVH